MPTPKPTSIPDDYERRYMHADESLARERVHMAWWGHALFAASFAGSIYAAVTGGPVVAPLLVGPLWLLLMTLRTAVTRSHVHVQLGIFGPKIPIARIMTAEVAHGSLLRTGWGVRFGLDGTITFSVPSATPDYLRIVYRRGMRSRCVHVMSADPARLVRAIEVAREEAQGGVRVADLAAREPARLDELSDATRDEDHVRRA